MCGEDPVFFKNRNRLYASRYIFIIEGQLISYIRTMGVCGSVTLDERLKMPIDNLFTSDYDSNNPCNIFHDICGTNVSSCDVHHLGWSDSRFVY